MGIGIPVSLARLFSFGAKAAPTAGKIAGGLSNAARATTTPAVRMASSPAFKEGLGKLVFGNMDSGEILGRLAPDVMFGGMAALSTPGDIGDKLIAGGTSALGGGLGGIALSRGASRVGLTGMPNYLADMAGSIGGDYAGMAVGDTLMRGKDYMMGGGGMTPYERLSAEQQQQLIEQVRAETLMGAGLVPGYRGDDYLTQLGLTG